MSWGRAAVSGCCVARWWTDPAGVTDQTPWGPLMHQYQSTHQASIACQSYQHLHVYDYMDVVGITFTHCDALKTKRSECKHAHSTWAEVLDHYVMALATHAPQGQRQ